MLKSLALFLSFVFILSNFYAQNINYDNVQDVRGKNVFEFSIHPSLPNLKFVLIGDSTDNSIIEIIIYKITDTVALQDINIDDVVESPGKNVEYFKTCDFNFDGYKDIMLLEFWGATGNRLYKAWLYNPKEMQFETNKFLSMIYSPEFDYNRKEFTMLDKGGFGEFSYSTYKCIKNKFILVKEKNQYFDKKLNSYFEDVYERKSRKMKLISHKKNKRIY